MKIVLSTLHSRYSQNTLALPYLKANLKQPQETSIVEFNINMNICEIIEELYHIRPDVLAFSCYIWNIKQTLNICEDIKKLLPDTFIILGGPEISYEVEYILNNFESIDVIVSGEGDEVFNDLIQSLKNKSDYRNIPGLCYKNKETDQVYVNDPVYVKDLTKIITPFDKEYIKTDKGFIYFETSRGCPFNCSYCLSGLSGPVRFFPLEEVKKNLLTIIESDFDTVRTIDRTFNINEERAIEIMDFIIKHRNSSQLFQFEIKADIISDNFLEFLKDVPKGAFQFEIGIQSVNPVSLAAANRKENLDRLFYVLEKLISYQSIHIHTDLICGLLDETKNTFIQAINRCMRLFPDTLQINTLKILKGSSLGDTCIQDGYKVSNMAPYPILSTPTMDYEEILHFEKIAKLVNIFFNSENFRELFQYLFEIYAPYEIFVDFLKYFEEREINIHSISRRKQYRIMNDFIILLIEENVKRNKALEFIKLDFISSSTDFKEKYSNINIEKKTLVKDNENKDNQYNISENTRFKIGKGLSIEEFKTLQLPFLYKNKFYYYMDREQKKNIQITDEKLIQIIHYIDENKNKTLDDLIKTFKVQKILILNLIKKNIIKKI